MIISASYKTDIPAFYGDWFMNRLRAGYCKMVNPYNRRVSRVDLTPRAVQIAAASRWIKARQIAPDAEPERLNLVVSNLRLGSLPDHDPALVELRRALERETGIPGELTDIVIHTLPPPHRQITGK